jgi:mycobactin peptide synthetase MbtE
MAEILPLGEQVRFGRTLPDTILLQARRTPEAVAVRQGETVLTYRELISRAAAIAAELRALGAGPESRVGLCAGRHPDTLAGLLGVWLAGAAYVPVDLANPGPRGRDILADAGAGIVVADSAGRERLGDRAFRYVDPRRPAHAAADPEAVPPGAARPENLAYVMYTSGSSGRPKGVLTTHQNLADWVAECRRWACGVGPEMRALALHSLAFDASCYDLFVPLAHGGSVQLVGEDDRADPARLERFIAAHAVTWAAAPPGVAALLDPGALPHLQTLIVGGEVVPPQLVGKWTAGTGCRFYHAYGPTEATVVQVATELGGQWTAPLPMGAALPGQRLHLLDARGAPVATGAEGELCIAGTGVARGYLNRPGLTAERFVPEPDSPAPGARMYRTGDVVRRLPDGELRFVGRRDGQAQVRGQRVEVGEVEAALREHPGVVDVAVVAAEVRGNTELVAFLAPVAAAAERPEAGRLREFVAARLPAAMVPRHLEWVEQLPLTVSGKIDRKRLLERASRLLCTGAAAAGDAPLRADAVPPAVAELWQRVLGGGTPAPDVDFFHLGGHSLDAMRLAAAIRDELGREVEAADIFASRTLAALALRVADAAAQAAPAPAARQRPALSVAQRRLWFLDKLRPGFAAYNIVFAERLRGEVDAGALRAALAAVAERQSVLRWRIVDEEGQPVAVCDPPGPVAMPVVEIARSELPDALTRATDKAFDLARRPLWTAVLYRLWGSGDHVLVLSFHHAIMDGWSQEVLYADLAAAYRQARAGTPPRLPALAFGYADYVAWRAERDGASADADLRWWTDHLRGAPATLRLPRDRAPLPVRSTRGCTVGVDLDARLDRAVRTLAASLGVTPAMVVLGALGQALHRLTGSDDVVVGAVVADRGLAATHDLVGFCVDVVPLRLRAERGASFASAVRSAGEELRAASAHPGATLDQMVDALDVPRHPGESPLVQVVFNAYNLAPPRLDLPGIEARTVAVPMRGAPVELTVYLVERRGRLALDLRHDTDLYDADRIRALGDDLLDLLSHLAASPDRPAAEAPTRFRLDSAGAPPAGLVPGWSTLVAAAPAAAGAGPSPSEAMVSAVWCDVLGLSHVRGTDNFFDIGGDSFALVQVQVRLSEAAGRPVPLIDLFRFPSVRSLADHLDGAAQESELIGTARMIAAQRARNRRRLRA